VTKAWLARDQLPPRRLPNQRRVVYLQRKAESHGANGQKKRPLDEGLMIAVVSLLIILLMRFRRFERPPACVEIPDSLPMAWGARSRAWASSR
jgi:hypothetical protein